MLSWKEAFRRLDEEDKESLKKFWRLQKQIEKERAQKCREAKRRYG